MTTRFQARPFAYLFDYVPTTIILTRSGDISPDHPSLRNALGPVRIFYAGGRDCRPLPEPWPDRNVRVRRLPADTTISEIVSRLKRDGERISIEAGPSTTNPLYDTRQIDAILLSTFHGQVDDEFTGPATVPIQALRSEFRRVWSLESSDGDRWNFAFHVRNELEAFIVEQAAALQTR